MKNEMLSILEGNKTNLSSRQFVGRDLPHPLLLGQEEKQPCFTRDVEDSRVLAGRANSGMTGLFYHGNNAFTLIELLVVVLIIGILAAVAVPQYQKAVWKSRFAQAKTLAHSLAEAEEIYYMANGKYTDDFEELSIDLPATSFDAVVHQAYFPWGYCEIGCVNNTRRCEVDCALTKNGADYLKYYISFNYSSYDPGKRTCLAYGTTGKPAAGDINYQLCKSDTNTYPISWGDTTWGWNY